MPTDLFYREEKQNCVFSPNGRFHDMRLKVGESWRRVVYHVKLKINDVRCTPVYAANRLPLVSTLPLDSLVKKGRRGGEGGWGGERGRRGGEGGWGGERGMRRVQSCLDHAVLTFMISARYAEKRTLPLR